MTEDDHPLIWGKRAVAEALNEGSRVNRIYCAKESGVRVFTELLELAKAHGVRYDIVPLAKLNVMTGVSDHQGIAARISPVAYTPLADVLNQCGPKACLLILDQVHHPKNVGMLIRTACGAGVSAVVLVSRGGALLDADVLRASAGTLTRMPVVTAGNLRQLLQTLKDQGFWIYGLDGAGEAEVHNFPWADRTALVMGNEATGLRPGTQKACDALLRIPLANNLDSLNVAVAGGMALFEVKRTLGI